MFQIMSDRQRAGWFRTTQMKRYRPRFHPVEFLPAELYRIFGDRGHWIVVVVWKDGRPPCMVTKRKFLRLYHAEIEKLHRYAYHNDQHYCLMRQYGQGRFNMRSHCSPRKQLLIVRLSQPLSRSFGIKKDLHGRFIVDSSFARTFRQLSRFFQHKLINKMISMATCERTKPYNTHHFYHWWLQYAVLANYEQYLHLARQDIAHGILRFIFSPKPLTAIILAFLKRGGEPIFIECPSEFIEVEAFSASPCRFQFA